jgi:radical SAM protein with 4Fe4S-binding SPASM domain
MFSDAEKPFLKSPWILRDDGKNLLVYQLNNSELKYFILSPVQAISLPFFDGTREFSIIKECINRIFLKLSIPLDLFNGLLHTFIIENIVGIEGAKSLSLINGNKLPIPILKDYKWPSERLAVPVSLYIALTNNCTTNCLYCYAERKRCKELTIKEWMTIFDQFDKYQIKLVDLGGGDVLTRSDIKTILKEMVNRGYKFFLSTKTHINLEMAEFFLNNGIGSGSQNFYELQISIDSHIETTASFLTQTHNYLARTLSSLSNLKKFNIFPRLKCVLTPYNFHDIEGFMKFFYSKGISKFQFVCYSRSFYRHSDELFLKKEHKINLPIISKRIREQYPTCDIVIQEESDSEGKEITLAEKTTNWNNRSICTGGRACLVVMPNGDVTLCDQIPHTHEFVIGNLLQNDLKDIWDSKSLETLLHPHRKQFATGVCSKCDIFDECHTIKGYCYRESLFVYNTIFEAPPSCPKQTKIGLKMI